MDIHNYQHQLERQIELIQADRVILPCNKEKVIEFKDYLLSEGIGVAKIGRYMLDAKKFCHMFGKPVEKATEADIRKIVGTLEQTDLAAETKRCFKIFVRKFYRFLHGLVKKGEYPPEVSWISIALSQKHRKMPEELLNEREIKEIIRACECVRDKALASVLSESGARVSEIGTMKIKNVSFEAHGARLSISGKTGARRILVIYSAPYLQEWINQHPCNANPDAPLWHNPRGEFLSYARITAILKIAARKVGIKKRIYPHLLRHSRATMMASIMSEAAMKQYFGWTQGSQMAAIYVHMSGRDTDNAVLRANGIEIEQESKIALMKPQLCLRCGTENESTNLVCKKCSLPLDEMEAHKVMLHDANRAKASEIMNQLLQDPEVLALLSRKLGGLGNSIQPGKIPIDS